METSTKYVLGAVIVIVLAIVAFVLFSPKASAPTNAPADSAAADAGIASPEDATTSQTGVSASVTIGAPVTVHYTASGFSPKSVTVKAGQAVSFVNDTQSPMWVASNVHPNHTDYDGTSRSEHCAPGYAGPAPFDQCGAGGNYTFTFTKAGTWPYHNHAGAEDGGTVVVTQ